MFIKYDFFVKHIKFRSTCTSVSSNHAKIENGQSNYGYKRSQNINLYICNPSGISKPIKNFNCCLEKRSEAGVEQTSRFSGIS